MSKKFRSETSLSEHAAPTLKRRVPSRLVGFGMSRHMGPGLSLFARRYMQHIIYPDKWIQRIRELSQYADIVYVHRTRNIAAHLALATVLKRENLPLCAFVGGLNTAWLQPWFRSPRTLAGLFRTKPRHEVSRLKLCISEGLPAQLFLRRPLTLVNASPQMRVPYIETLITEAKNRERPIMLMPHFLALRSEPGKFEPTAADAIFGSADAPGTLRALARLMLSRGVARFEISEPIDLTAFVKAHEGQPDKILAKKVRWSILHHLARIERGAHGPPLKSFQRMRDDVFRDALLQRAIKDEAKEKKQTVAVVKTRAEKLYNGVAAKPDFDWARLMDKIVRLIWRIIYDGLVIDQSDVDRVREAARHGPLVLVPSHRSHVDYLVMSQAFLWNGLLPPYVAAGENLNFFPLGALLRRGGGYFIRRSFGGDPVYAEVVKAYVRRLYREGFTQEFFIEGGRSRTGKTLAPKMGMLKMLIDAFLDSRQPDAIFVPAHIAYEKIIEAGAYSRELQGEEKEKESATALMKTAGVLKARYGTVFITFDEPISLAQFIADRGYDKEKLKNASESERRSAVQHMAFRIVYGINNAVMVTANAIVCTVLYGFRGRGIEQAQIERATDLLLAHLHTITGGKVRLSHGLRNDRHGAARAALNLLREEKKVETKKAADREFFRIADDALLELEFYKNSILHFFIGEAIVAAAMRSLGARPGVPLDRAPLAERARQLSRMLKFEFTFEDRGFSVLLDETLARIASYGVIEVHDASNAEAQEASTTDAATTRKPASVMWREDVKAARWGAFGANLVGNFFDAYWSVATHIESVLTAAPDHAMKKKSLILALLELMRADVHSGAVKCIEAVNKSNVENALDLLTDQQIVSLKDKNVHWLDAGEDRLTEMREMLDQARGHVS